MLHGVLPTQVETQLIGSFEALKAQMQHQHLPIDPARKEAMNLKQNFIHLLRKQTQLVNFVVLNVKAFEKLIKVKLWLLVLSTQAPVCAVSARRTSKSARNST